tara:strand:+ start:150 stop:464 length:315 start_codon:yes stop_codon:yes gene_type:complete
MYYSKPDQPLKEERIQSELDRMAGMKERQVAEMIVEMRLQLALNDNSIDWLDGLAMLLRDEPDRYHVDEDGYEDEDNPLCEHELWTRYKNEENRLIKIWHEDVA